MPWAYGTAAKAALIGFIEGKTVNYCDLGPNTKYNRRIGTCFADGQSVESWLVRAGWAIKFKKHSDWRFAADELVAQAERIGLWSSCFADPRDHRFVMAPVSQELEPPANPGRFTCTGVGDLFRRITTTYRSCSS